MKEMLKVLNKDCLRPEFDSLYKYNEVKEEL